MKISQCCVYALVLLSLHVSAEDESDGFLAPQDLDERYYLEQMQRVPERMGLICWSAYEMHKEGRHGQSLRLLHACADQGLVVPMLMLANLHQLGLMDGISRPDLARLWLQRAAASGDSRGQLYYGLALQQMGDLQAGRWLQLAADQGEPVELLWQAAQR